MVDGENSIEQQARRLLPKHSALPPKLILPSDARECKASAIWEKHFANVEGGRIFSDPGVGADAGPYSLRDTSVEYVGGREFPIQNMEKILLGEVKTAHGCISKNLKIAYSVYTLHPIRAYLDSSRDQSNEDISITLFGADIVFPSGTQGDAVREGVGFPEVGKTYFVALWRAGKKDQFYTTANAILVENQKLYPLFDQTPPRIDRMTIEAFEKELRAAIGKRVNFR